MSAPLTFTVPGEPVPKARPRHGLNGNVYTPRTTRVAEAVIRARFIQAAGPGRVVRRDPVKLTLGFHCSTVRRVDLDNLAKTVLDALNALAYVDDSLIHALELRKVLGVGTPRAHTEITIEDCPNV